MRIAILSRSRFIFSTRRLIEAAKTRGHDVTVVNTLACALGMVGRDFSLLHHGEPLPTPDVVLPRIGTSITDYGIAVVKQFELMGVPVLNSERAISLSRDKLQAAQFMASQGLATPPTVALRDPTGLEALVEQLGGPPVIVKPVRGTQGVGVMLMESVESIRAISETMWGLGQNFVMQKFISEARGRDIRAFVVGGRVVAAMRRTSQRGEFRANIHRGGKGQRLSLSRPYSRLAVRAATLMGLEVAGVDMLETRRGPLVLEVNSSPGLEGIERYTGTNVASAIIRRAEALARRRS
ncbi:RimK family alpha-L-glutamate ligase [bacterium]|nr:MAG: RimK family alpha-L-glutamate ligase [bacterium]RIK60094.1 MAG: 30S ribosomal protein S6--L-glutamate ligase [Planctomycetota bacterium]